MRNHISALAIGFAIVALGPASAQVDPAKALVGTWQGEIDFGGLPANPGRDPNRTLIIDSVTQKDGKWVGEGRFGFTGKNLGRVSMEVDPGAGKPSIRFAVPAGATIRLQLIGDKQLNGIFQAPGTSARGNERPMRLDRKE